VESQLSETGKIKTITNTMGLGKDKSLNVIKWDPNSFNVTLTMAKFNMYWNNLFIKEADTLALTSFISTKKGEETVTKLTYKNTQELHEMCSTMDIHKMGSFGSCYTLFNGKKMQGIVYKQLQFGEYKQQQI